MMHKEIWRALELLAAENGLSTSGLARQAGLDATTFSRSKRHMPDGRYRWPSTESLAKALEATGTSLSTFSQLVSGDRALASGTNLFRRIPIIDIAETGGDGHFDEAGFPVGSAWSTIDAPEIRDRLAYALEISGSLMQPVYRNGDIVIVSPSTPIRNGDRVVVRTARNQTIARQLVRQSTRHVELSSLIVGDLDCVFDLANVAWIHRIVWVTQ